jgi:hypothetical protein
MSTLISDLDGTPGGSDGDFVQSILNEMNGGPQQPPIQPPPAVGPMMPQGSVISAPNPNTIAPRVMDNGPTTAHMIGNAHPTPADFAQIMGGGGGGAGGPVAAPQGDANYAAVAPPTPSYVPSAPKRSFLMRVADEFRTAILVSILVLTFSLPVVNFLFAHYLPRLVKPTGELTMIGLLVKSLGAGAAYWALQRVIIPLLSF